MLRSSIVATLALLSYATLFSAAAQARPRRCASPCNKRYYVGGSGLGKLPAKRRAALVKAVKARYRKQAAKQKGASGKQRIIATGRARFGKHTVDVVFARTMFTSKKDNTDIDGTDELITFAGATTRVAEALSIGAPGVSGSIGQYFFFVMHGKQYAVTWAAGQASSTVESVELRRLNKGGDFTTVASLPKKYADWVAMDGSFILVRCGGQVAACVTNDKKDAALLHISVLGFTR